MRLPTRLLRKKPKRNPQELRWVVIDGPFDITRGLIAIRKAKNGKYIWGYAEFSKRENPVLFWELVNISAIDALENSYKRPKKRKVDMPT